MIRFATALGLGVALVLTGCGLGSAPGSSPGSTPSASPTATSPTATGSPTVGPNAEPTCSPGVLHCTVLDPWSGYSLQAPNGLYAIGVQAQWRAPQISCHAFGERPRASVWVGLWGSNSSMANNTGWLPQIGTSSDCSGFHPRDSYHFVWEMAAQQGDNGAGNTAQYDSLPCHDPTSPDYNICAVDSSGNPIDSMPISARDRIFAQITLAGPASPQPTPTPTPTPPGPPTPTPTPTSTPTPTPTSTPTPTPTFYTLGPTQPPGTASLSATSSLPTGPSHLTFDVKLADLSTGDVASGTITTNWQVQPYQIVGQGGAILENGPVYLLIQANGLAQFEQPIQMSGMKVTMTSPVAHPGVNEWVMERNGHLLARNSDLQQGNFTITWESTS